MKGCENVQSPPSLTISSRFERFMHRDLWSATAPFNIGYRMVYAEHRSPWQVQVEFFLEKAVCISMSCTHFNFDILLVKFNCFEFFCSRRKSCTLDCVCQYHVRTRKLPI